MELPGDLLAALEKPAICNASTLMPDGSPQISQTWVDTDGRGILINTVDTRQKTRNVERDPRIAVGIVDPATSSRSWHVRGRVVSAVTDGADEHINQLSHRCAGRPYPGFDGGQRVLLTVEVDKLHVPFAG